jgi:3',5'-cyclic AMP phosphodiesterase CpdA
MQAHDPYVVAALESEIRMAARGVGLVDDRFDFYVVTGDISTNANAAPRFSFARQFLTGTLLVDNFPVGLRLPADRLLCIPGNHDVMFETSPERYLSAFSKLPAAPPYVWKGTARNGRQFAFYAIDSNAYGEGNIALGKIKVGTFGWLLDQLTMPVVAGTIRILLLHHHPVDLNRFRSWSLRNLILDRFTALQEGDRLLQGCRGRIDVVMHGHEHFPIAFRDEESGCIIVSAGTASEWQGAVGHSNSFHVLLFRGPSLEVLQFEWNGARFKEVNRWDFALRQ